MTREARTTVDPSPGAETAECRQMRAYPVRLHAAGGHAWFARSVRSGPGPIGRPIAALPALLEAERRLAGQRRSVGKRAIRSSSADVFAPARSHLPRPTGPQLLLAAPGPSGGANDNAVTGSGSGLISGRLREGFFLALLAVLLAATFYLGRQNAFHNVIVVPEPWSSLSVLT